MVAPSASRSPVFLFIGEDRFLKEKALRELGASLLGDPSRELDYKVFHGSDADAKELLDYINTLPFLAEKKFAVIKNAGSLPSELRESLIQYIKKPAKSTCLVLEAADDSVIDSYGEAARYMNIRRFDNVTGRELVSWMNEFLMPLGKTIDADAVTMLKELQGNNLLTLTHELEKLAAFTGKRKKIASGDVEEVVGRSLTRSAFKITAAIDKGKTGDAIRICSDLIKSGKKEYEILGLLCWHLKKLLKAKAMKSKGAPSYSIASALKVSKRDQEEFFSQVSGLKMADIRSGIKVLLEADLDIKRTKTDPTLVLELAVIRLCLGQR